MTDQWQFRCGGNTSATLSGADRDALGRALQGFGSLQLDPPPDPYAGPIAALRTARGHTDGPNYGKALAVMDRFRDRLREQALSAGLALPPATGDVYANPPNGYEDALKKLEGRR